jgi:SAM-dependent methyltransferase
MDCLLSDRIDLIETDVSFGARTQAIVDAHNIPFKDGSLDGVVAQAVLEHVLDPQRCVDEIHRVLKPDGLVYAETPFMQQVHAGPYDFTRFTHLGHRRLFRRFEELDSGAVCGPGMALAWTYQYFLMSFFTSGRMRKLATAFAHVTAFWLKWFDAYLIDKPGCLDAASGVYFLGRKSESVYPDSDLIASYRGAIGLLKPRN